MMTTRLSFSTTTHQLNLSAAGCSLRGTERENNEDSIHIAPNLELFIVADGVGGERAGELASSTAIREIVDETSNWPVTGDDDDFRRLMNEALHHASQVIRELIEIDDEFRGAATTITLGFRLDDHLFIANVGDSRAYRLRNGRLQQLTVDDSWVEILVRSGSITREEARTHPQRNVILSSLGNASFDEYEVEIGVMSLRPGDRFLISSDGLHDALDDNELTQVLGADESMEIIADRLVARSIQAGSTDDTSAVVLDVSTCVQSEAEVSSAIARVLERVRNTLSRSRAVAVTS